MLLPAPEFPVALVACGPALAMFLAVTPNLDSGLVVGGAALLGMLFRYLFKETKRKDDSVWEIADEYRLERDYDRAVAAHWQARYLNLLDQRNVADIPPMPDLETMRNQLQRLKKEETPRGIFDRK